MAAGTRTAAGMRHNVFFRVDVISYSSAIIACEQGRKWKHALQRRQTVLFEREGNRCQKLFAQQIVCAGQNYLHMHSCQTPLAFFSWTQYFCTSPSLYMQTDSSD